MSWADQAIKTLKEDGWAIIYPKGNSMSPLIKSGQRVSLKACGPYDVREGEIVLCKVKGNVYLHLVKAIGDGRVLIGNNKGRTNGWTRTIYGRMI